jgi:hypothetical protein
MYVVLIKDENQNIQVKYACSFERSAQGIVSNYRSEFPFRKCWYQKVEKVLTYADLELKGFTFDDD